MKLLGEFKKNISSLKHTYKVDDLVPGANDLGDYLAFVSPEGRLQHIVNKVCDHAGGRLSLKNGKAVCPLHGWTLSLETLKYNDSHVCKEKIPYTVSPDGELIISDESLHIENPFIASAKLSEMTVRWLNHACVLISYGGFSIITDPWLIGPAFMGGWWLSEASPAESLELMSKADYVYISHNHPDHFHAETLAYLSKDKPIIVPDFVTKSCESSIRSIGFTNVHAVPFGTIWELSPDFQISVLKSGDFRDDSGLYVCAGGKQALLTVDCKFLNKFALPRNIDLLMTNFASGASGFPLCYEDISEEEKRTILSRNRGASLSSASKHIRATSPRYYMPYAGMFLERANRDKEIRENNKKNHANDLRSIADAQNVEFLSPDSSSVYVFKDEGLCVEKIPVKSLEFEDPSLYINKLKNEHLWDSCRVIEYLRKSGYKGHQILQLIPTDDDFNPVASFIYADFLTQEFEEKELGQLLETKTGYRVMRLKVRQEIIMAVVDGHLPWEDFSIGFQMRVKRSPNEYESDFWYHFTNIYIKQPAIT